MLTNSTLCSPADTPTSEKHKKALQFIEEMTRNADVVQKNVLAQILTENAQTEYLKGFNLGGATDRETFKSKVPVVTYKHLQPLIQRIADGDQSPILCAHPISELTISTGTSGGESKLFPYIEEDGNRRGLIRSLLMPYESCFFGLNLNPMCETSEVSYTLMPNMAYFEFLPHGPHSLELTHHPKLVDLVDVEIGKEYELVVTTCTGLYRYQIGDVLRVTGSHNSAPQFQFVKRKNALLSIESDKTDEGELQFAIDNACKLLEEFDTNVVEYTSYADTRVIPGHYVIYWELLQQKDSNKMPSDKVLEQCCLILEESFNSIYRRFRVEDKSIGPLEIRIVKSGTFEKLMDYVISKGASIDQYKVARYVNSASIMDILDSAIVSTHFNPSLPHWSEKWSPVSKSQP